MKRILTAVVLIPLVLLLIFKGSFLAIVVATAAVAELACWEYLGLAEAMGIKTPRVLVLLAIALLYTAAYFNADLVMPAVALCSFGLFAVCTFRSPLERVLPDTASSVFALIYIGVSLISIPLLAAQGGGSSLLLFLFSVVWSGDVAGLYAGRSFGRHSLAPRISPKKTWEGSAASMAGSIAVAALLFWLAHAFGERVPLPISYAGSIGHWLVLAVLLNAAAQLGDLVESAIKRGSGVKDSGSLLPGHGGILDRVDALLLAAPLLWYAQFAQQYF